MKFLVEVGIGAVYVVEKNAKKDGKKMKIFPGAKMQYFLYIRSFNETS